MINAAILEEQAEELEEGAYEEEGEIDPITGVVLPRSKGKDISNILKANSEMPDFSINPFDSDSCKPATGTGNETVDELDAVATTLEKANADDEATAPRSEERRVG